MISCLYRTSLLLLLTAPLALAQTADHDYTRTTYASEATFVYAESEEGRILTMVPAGAVVGVDVCDEGWCPVRYEGTTGFAPRSVLTSAPGIPIQPSTANPDVFSAPSHPAERPSRDRMETVNPLPETYEELHMDLVEAAFVGSKRSQVYHLASCSHVSRIAEHNLVTYESAADVREQGKRPCKVCHPADN